MNQSTLNRARLDKFLMVLDIPKIFKKYTDLKLEESYSADSIQFSCYGSPVPQININPIDLSYGGQTFKFSSNTRPSYQSLNFNFLIDNGYKNYWTIFQWLNIYNDAKTGKIGYNFSNLDNDNKQQQNTVKNKIPFSDAVTVLKTYGLDEYNNKIIEFTYNGAFPVSLGEIEYSYQNPNEATCKVSFVFNQVVSKLIKNISDKNC